MATVLLTLGVLYFLSHVLSGTFERTRVPDVLVLMLLGLLVGPVFKLVEPVAFGRVGPVLTTIALAVILFEGGLGLDVRAIRESAARTLLVALATAGATIVAVAVLAMQFAGLAPLQAAILGCVVSGTSSAVVIPMVRALKPGEGPATILILESALTDVTCIVLTFALLQAATRGEVQVTRVIGQTLAAFLFAAAIGFGGGLLWLRVWERVRAVPGTTFSTVAWAFVLYGVTELLGFSGAICVLSLGLTLGNADLLPLDRWFKGSRRFGGVTAVEEGFFAELVFLLKTFFFVFLGISERIDDPQMLAIAAVLVLAVYGMRLLLTRFTLPRTTPVRDAAIVSLMVPKGLAAAVVAGLPLQQGVPQGEEIQILGYAIVLVSITLTAVLVLLMDTAPMRGVYGAVFRGFGTARAAGPPPVAA